MKDSKFNAMRDEAIKEISRRLDISLISECRFKVQDQDCNFEVAIVRSSDDLHAITYEVHNKVGDRAIINLYIYEVDHIVDMINRMYRMYK